MKLYLLFFRNTDTVTCNMIAVEYPTVDGAVEQNKICTYDCAKVIGYTLGTYFGKLSIRFDKLIKKIR